MQQAGEKHPLGLDPERTWAYVSQLLEGEGDLNRVLYDYGEARAQEAATLLGPHQLATFIERLEGPAGCDFQEDAAGKTTWSCPGGTDLTQARAVLVGMVAEGMALTPEQIEILLGCFVALGGHCSCEVLFNAVERIEKAIEKRHG